MYLKLFDYIRPIIFAIHDYGVQLYYSTVIFSVTEENVGLVVLVLV